MFPLPPRFEYHMFYVLYPSVVSSLTLPRMTYPSILQYTFSVLKTYLQNSQKDLGSGTRVRSSGAVVIIALGESEAQ
jgi:hypothetical protein